VTSQIARNVEFAEMTEALWRVRSGPIWQFYGPPAGKKRAQIAIYRIVNLSFEQRIEVAQAAYEFLGRRYGWWKLVAHAADSIVSRELHREVYLFRRLLCSKRYPICSFLVEAAFERVGIDFAPDQSADPDHIHDYCERDNNSMLVFQGVLGEKN
jgi:hypothetical protein